jgi:hypothetical protein
MLQEDRIVLMEKIGRMGQRDVLVILGYIDKEIKSGVSLTGGINAFIPKGWVKNKMIRKVLEDNGYKIDENVLNVGYISEFSLNGQGGYIEQACISKMDSVDIKKLAR